jgi:hypothetical protein
MKSKKNRTLRRRKGNRKSKKNDRAAGPASKYHNIYREIAAPTGGLIYIRDDLLKELQADDPMRIRIKRAADEVESIYDDIEKSEN